VDGVGIIGVGTVVAGVSVGVGTVVVGAGTSSGIGRRAREVARISTFLPGVGIGVGDGGVVARISTFVLGVGIGVGVIVAGIGIVFVAGIDIHVISVVSVAVCVVVAAVGMGVGILFIFVAGIAVSVVSFAVCVIIAAVGVGVGIVFVVILAVVVLAGHFGALAIILITHAWLLCRGIIIVMMLPGTNDSWWGQQMGSLGILDSDWGGNGDAACNKLLLGSVDVSRIIIREKEGGEVLTG